MSGVGRAAWVAAAVAVLVFLPSIGNGFAYDDISIIVEHEALHDVSNLPALATEPYWPGGEGEGLGAWRPLTTISFALLWAIGGGQAWIFHLANVLLHGAVTGMVAVVAGLLAGPVAAWVAGLLFAVHPVHVEAVANGVGFAELMSSALVLAACLLLLRQAPRTRLRPRIWLGLGGLYALAILTKENAAVLPALLVLLDAARERIRVDELAGYLRRRLPLFGTLTVVLGVLLLARRTTLGSAVAGYPPLGAEWLAEAPRIWTMAAVWLEYVRLLLWPVELSPDYSPPRILLRHGWDPTSLMGLALVLGLLGGAWWMARRERPDSTSWRDGMGLPLGLLWFVMALLPVSNLFFVTGIVLAERTLYLPSAGVLVGLGALLATPIRAHGHRLVVPAAVVVLLLAGRSLTYSAVWRSSETVFQHMVEVVPESGRSRWVMADVYMETGTDSLSLRAYRETVSHLGESYAFLTRSAGRLAENGYPDHALALYRRAWQVDSTRILAPRRLAILAQRRSDWPATERWAGRALAVDDAPVELWHLYAAALAGQGRWADAARAREDLLSRGERQAWQQWVLLAEARFRAGSMNGGADAVDSALARGAPAPAVERMRVLRDSVAGAR